VKVILFGGTGMVGTGVLIECLEDPRVHDVLVVGRSSTGRPHPKVREARRTDFVGYDDLRADFAACDACFFCLGVSSLGLNEAEYTHVTYDLTLAAAKALRAANDHLTFCYVSGVGTDSSERGRSMWGRVKGRTENALLALGFKAAFMFRPGYIQPVKGVRSKTGWVQALYTLAAPVYPTLKRLAPRQITTTATLGRAMIEVAARGYPRQVLEPPDINAAGAGT
jgi:uncharacterized protein YbjT (DUF2867 family)